MPCIAILQVISGIRPVEPRGGAGHPTPSLSAVVVPAPAQTPPLTPVASDPCSSTADNKPVQRLRDGLFVLRFVDESGAAPIAAGSST